MPTYDYKCDKGHVTELRVSHPDSAPPFIRCTVLRCNVPCDTRADKVTVYAPGVNGDLPTRGSF